MVFKIVSVAEMQFMAGENVDATGDVTANHQFLHDYAAAYLSMLIQYDIITNWDSPLVANFKPLLTNGIRGVEPWYPGYFVGGYPDPIPSNNSLIEIGWDKIIGEDKRSFMVVKIRIFGYLGAPVYRVVVGEL